MISPRAQVQVSLGALEARVKTRLARLTSDNFVERLQKKEPLLWTTDRTQYEEIRNRLGWLTVAEAMQKEIPALEAFAAEVHAAGLTDVVLLGMGGSSLCPDVFRKTFTHGKDRLRLYVLDSTDPIQVQATAKQVDPKQTLFVVASKSGSTTEVQSFYQYFYEKIGDGSHFVAITDKGSVLDKLAQEKKFRRIFRNPADIGGRYSALSYFGLVPAALIGMDLERLLGSATRMTELAAGDPLQLGAILGECALAGRDKVTFIASPEISSFGSWIEQLIAESTGKEGKGIVPVDLETIAGPDRYGQDRLFVYVRFSGTRAPELDQPVNALEQAGHPVIHIHLEDLYDLGGEFFRWEYATAVAGSVLGINPFDQPNVQESKDLTKSILADYENQGSMVANETPHYVPGPDLENELKTQFQNLAPGDYVALLAYLPMDEAHERSLRQMQTLIRDRSQHATTLGFGPRFLHSTGQLHKGGPNHGLFLQITSAKQPDLPIPGRPYSFGILQAAQAQGDRQALMKRDRRIVHIHLTDNSAKALERLLTNVTNALRE